MFYTHLKLTTDEVVDRIKGDLVTENIKKEINRKRLRMISFFSNISCYSRSIAESN